MERQNRSLASAFCSYFFAYFFFSVDQNEFKRILADIDVGLFSLSAKHTAHNFPGKLLGYMVESLPILGSINQDNDLIDLIHEFDAGFISINGNDELFFDNAVKLYKSEELRIKMGLGGNNLLRQQFDVSNIASTITQSLANI